jgi:outer membrane protein TolC
MVICAGYFPVRGQDAMVFSREQCVDYALENRPSLLAAREEMRLSQLDNRIAASAWLPEVSVSGNAQHYFQLPVSIFPDFENPGSGETREVQVGTVNSSTLTFSARQTLYNPIVAAAVRRQEAILRSARLSIEREEIAVKEEVSEAFYRTLRARERLRLLGSDLLRQEEALEDAHLLFENGLTDKVDYKRAIITLNRTRLERDNAVLELQSQRTELKRLMGFPDLRELELSYDYAELSAATFGDSLPPLQTNQRVEYQLLEADNRLQDLELLYLRRAWLPDLSFGGSYNLNWQSNALRNLYDRMFPNSLVSLDMSVPLFNGGRRFRQVERQRVVQDQLALDLLSLRDRIAAEYRIARNGFRQARNTYRIARENRDLAAEIYEVVDLQYREGITPFLSVIIAENDLQAARLSMLDGLIDAAIARIDVRRAAGTL